MWRSRKRRIRKSLSRSSLSQAILQLNLSVSRRIRRSVPRWRVRQGKEPSRKIKMISHLFLSHNQLLARARNKLRTRSRTSHRQAALTSMHMHWDLVAVQRRKITRKMSSRSEENRAEKDDRLQDHNLILHKPSGCWSIHLKAIKSSLSPSGPTKRRRPT